MVARRVFKCLKAPVLASLVLACATPTSTSRPAADPAPAAAAPAEPIPPPPQKKSVIVPSDVNLGPGPAGPVNNGSAGPPVSPTAGTSSVPN
ncbi:MAG TPA: hypothetical protein VHM31_04955 [Polyangia bacterium]|nr:hypothetical protein [Polyangia bacterium]